MICDQILQTHTLRTTRHGHKATQFLTLFSKKSQWRRTGILPGINYYKELLRICITSGSGLHNDDVMLWYRFSLSMLSLM